MTVAKFRYSSRSEQNLSECHPDLIRLFRSVLTVYDHTVTCGKRGEVEQEQVFRMGMSKLRYPHGKHNGTPSLAVDAVPHAPHLSNIWDLANPAVLAEWYKFAYIVRTHAANLGIKVNPGFDWDSDGNLSEHALVDFPHWELVL